MLSRLFPVAFLASCVAPPVAGGTSAADIGPLAHVDEVAIQVFVGDALEVEPQTATPLFAEDQRKSTELREAVVRRLAELLSGGGLKVSSSSQTVLDVSIFGGKFSESPTNYFLLEFSVCAAEEGACSPWRSTLGTSADEKLSVVLVETTVAVVREAVEKRTRYRASHP